MGSLVVTNVCSKFLPNIKSSQVLTHGECRNPVAENPSFKCSPIIQGHLCIHSQSPQLHNQTRAVHQAFKYHRDYFCDIIHAFSSGVFHSFLSPLARITSSPKSRLARELARDLCNDCLDIHKYKSVGKRTVTRGDTVPCKATTLKMKTSDRTNTTTGSTFNPGDSSV
jgi:hypothetical protein